MVRAFICIFISLTFSINGINAQSGVESSLVSSKGKKRPLLSASYSIWLKSSQSAKKWMPDALKDNSEMIHYDASVGNCFQVDATWKSGWICGMTYRNFKQNGTGIQIERRQNVTILFWDFDDVSGDIITIVQTAQSFGIMGGYRIVKVPDNYFVGTSIRFQAYLNYIHVAEKTDLLMQASFDPKDDARFNSKITHYMYTGSLNFRFDLQVSKYFSFILPEIGYEFGIYQEYIPVHRYSSPVDGDNYYVEKHKYVVSVFQFLAGASVHF